MIKVKKIEYSNKHLTTRTLCNFIKWFAKIKKNGKRING